MFWMSGGGLAAIELVSIHEVGGKEGYITERDCENATACEKTQ